jgi:hypothetical protein
MSVRSSLASPSTQSGEVGRLISASATSVASLAANAPQALTSVTLPAGSYIVRTQMEATTTVAASTLGFQLVVAGVGTVDNYFVDESTLTVATPQTILSFTNILTLTAASTVVTFQAFSGVAAAGITYNTAFISALKIA